MSKNPARSEDSNFNIHGDAKCLENLLALNAELTGTSFLSWLWDDKETAGRWLGCCT
jgi:hypothetical protein